MSFKENRGERIIRHNHSITELYTCSICNADVNKTYSIRRCQYCNKVLCKRCSEYGFCPEHFKMLEDRDKEVFKKKYKPPNYYVWIATIMIGIILIPNAIFRFDFFSELDPWFFYSELSFDIACFLIYSVIMIFQIYYRRKVKPSLYEIIKKYKTMDRGRDFVELTSIDAAFERLLGYYRTDQRIQAMFKDHNIMIAVKFIDSKRIYTIKIKQDWEISLDPNPPMKSPDIRIRVLSEQVLLDVLNKDLPLHDALTGRSLMIGKGAIKFIKLARKSPYKLGVFK